MQALLIPILGFIVSGLVWRVLASIGFSLVTTYFIRDVASDYINRALYQMQSNVPADVAALLNIVGADECISIWVGAITFVATYKSLKLMFVRS